MRTNADRSSVFAYFFDTQRDLTNNLLGTLAALLLIAAYYAMMRGRNRNGGLH